VTGDLTMVAAGAWERQGVCGYTLAGERVWQNKTRSGVQSVTALAAGRVAVGYGKGPAAVLDVATGQELRSLRGVTGVRALTPGMSLLESSTYVRFADTEFEPLGKRIELRSFAVVDAAASPEHVAMAEAGGPLRILDLDGVERAAHVVPGGHVLRVTYEHATGTWLAITSVDRGEVVDHVLLRLTDDAEVLEHRPFDFVLDATWLKQGAVLVYCNEDGVFVRQSSEATSRRLDVA
jgi:hypothetical protein